MRLLKDIAVTAAVVVRYSALFGTVFVILVAACQSARGAHLPMGDLR